MDEKLEKLLKAAPPMREAEMKAINALYPAFLFRRHRTRQIWTSCCGRSEKLSEYSTLMFEKHQAEIVERRHFGCGSYYPMQEPQRQEKVKCPYCGKEAVLKEVGRCGKGDNLFSFRRVVVLRWYKNALWGMGYNTEKGYAPRAETLTELPSATLTHIWRFAKGRVQYAQRDWWYGGGAWHAYMDIDTTHLMAGWKCPDGFLYCSEWGTGYDLIGVEEIEKSPFKYCNQHQYIQASARPMRFLALCTGYQRQVEMLLKAHIDTLVDDMVEKGKLNKRLFDWNQPNVLKSFGIQKDAMQEWISAGGDIGILEGYKKLRKAGIRCSMQELGELDRINSTQLEKLVQNMKQHGISTEKMLHYFRKQGAALERRSVEWWNDYIYAAERIGYDLTNPVFLLPKELTAAHDKATKSAAALKKDEKDKDYREKRLQKLKKKYTFWNERYLIRPPINAAEIVAEGKALKHCVGGYADRHISGKVTILFLRDKRRPGRPLVTIEMHANEIVQIHGWDDERTACKENPKKRSPRKIYAEFLDDWLDWLASGSKKKKGIPVIYKEATA